MPAAADPALLERVFRQEHGRVVATLIQGLGGWAETAADVG